MSTVVKSFRKSVIERRRLYLDYDCWLADTEKLTDFQVTIVPYTADAQLQVDNSFPDAAHRKLMVYVSGGKGNTDYTLQMVVRTSEGQTKRDDIGLRVMP